MAAQGGYDLYERKHSYSPAYERLRSESQKPDERFFEAMRELSAIGNNVNQLAAKANSLGFVDAPMLYREAERWHKFQADIESVFLRPDKTDLKWQ